jgi:hypothetical protein
MVEFWKHFFVVPKKLTPPFVGSGDADFPS